MSTCTTQAADLGRTDRIHISWPVTGVGAGDLAFISIEGGAWLPLVVAADLRTVIGYFAGPGYQVPGVAVVITRTSFVRIRIVTATETLTFGGGFVRLTP